jgi:hypothetical protein
MAVSLGFGVVFATFITLVIVPTLYVIFEDLKTAGLRLIGRKPAPTPSATSPTGSTE